MLARGVEDIDRDGGGTDGVAVASRGFVDKGVQGWSHDCRLFCVGGVVFGMTARSGGSSAVFRFCQLSASQRYRAGARLQLHLIPVQMSCENLAVNVDQSNLGVEVMFQIDQSRLLLSH